MSFFLSMYPLTTTYLLLILLYIFIYLLSNFMITTLFLFLWFTGCIDLSRLFKFGDIILTFLFRNSIEMFKKNIRLSFPVNGETDTKKQLIYMFHPHGTFSVSHVFNVVSNMTDWPRRDMKAVTHNWLMQTRMLPNLFTDKFVSSDYDSIKEALADGTSISICLGGSREGGYGNNDDEIVVIVGQRRGMFKLAIEAGVPIVPVLTYGEIKNINLDNLLQTWKRWGKIYKGILDTKIETFIGKEVDVGPARVPTEKEILDLKKKYIEALKVLYKDTKPDHYREELVII